MGFMDKAKDLINENQEKIDSAVDKAAHFASEKTGGKYDEKIKKGTDAVKKKTGDL